MKRKTFISIVSILAAIIGVVALVFPSILLDSKGVIPVESVKVWMREVGVLLLSMSLILFLVRNEESSRSLRAIFIGNICIQIGLLVIEVVAYKNDVIKTLSGIVPNGVLHLCLSIGFIYYLVKMNKRNNEALS